jgi:hypothetical protein
MILNMCALRDDKPAVGIDREPEQKRASTPQARAYVAHSAAGLHVKTTRGLATADIVGTRLTRAASPPHAFSSGLKPSASPARSGRRIRIGMLNNPRSSDPNEWMTLFPSR